MQNSLNSSSRSLWQFSILSILPDEGKAALGGSRKFYDLHHLRVWNKVLKEKRDQDKLSIPPKHLGSEA